jgi:type I restriction enzyme S subunit
VSAWERAKDEIATIRRRAAGLEEKSEADFLAELGLRKPQRAELSKAFSVQWKDFERWSVEYIKRTISESKSDRHRYSLGFLGDLCAGQSGSTPSKRNKSYWNGTIPWVSPKDMKTHSITETIDHITEKAINEGRAPLIPPKSVLVVVRSGILQHTVPIAVNKVQVSINQDMRALTPKPAAPILADFLAEYLRCCQHKLLTQVKWSTTVQSINKESIEGLEVPLPPLSVQRDLVDKVTAQRRKIAALKAEAGKKSQQAKADIEAMMLGTKPVPEGH